MKKLFLAILLGISPGAFSQTTLYNGDIGFTGYISKSGSSSIDTFSFAVLKYGGIDAETRIGFTDNGWISSWYPQAPNGCFRKTEGELEWTAPPGGLRFGEQVKIWTTGGKSNFGCSKGTLRIIGSNSISLNVTGDQLFAYQGDSLPLPQRILCGIHFHISADSFETSSWYWDSLAAPGSSVSARPPQLQTGALVLRRGALPLINAYYAGGTDTSFIALKTRVFDTLAWSGDLSGAPSFTLPPENGYTLPLELISFSGQKGAGGWYLSWNMSPAAGRRAYLLEQSADGRTWDSLASYAPKAQCTVFVPYPENGAPGNTVFRISGLDFSGQRQTLGIWLSKLGSWPDRQGLQWIGGTMQGPQLEGTLFSHDKAFLEITLSAYAGSIVWNEILEVRDGSRQLVMDPGALAQGWYLLEFRKQGESTGVVKKIYWR